MQYNRRMPESHQPDVWSLSTGILLDNCQDVPAQLCIPNRCTSCQEVNELSFLFIGKVLLVPRLAFSATLPDTLSCKVDLGTPYYSTAFRMLIVPEATALYAISMLTSLYPPQVGPLCEGYVHSYLAM